MKKIDKKLLTALSAMVLASSAQAEIFMCKDASGRTLTSDRPIPECSDRKMKVLDNQGVARREIAAPLTAEQKRARQEEEEKRKAAAAAAEEQKREDRALLARYKSEDDIEAARKREVQQAQEQIKRDEIALGVKESYLRETQKEAEAFKGKTMPMNLKQKLEMTEQSLDYSKKSIAEKLNDIAKINAKYDGVLKRYREVTASTQAAAPRPPAK